MIRCRIARGLIEAAQERALSLEQRFQLDEHLRRCPTCARHEHRTRGLQELLEGPGDPLPPTPDVEAAVRHVFAALDAGEGVAWQPRAPRRRILVASALVALAAALVALLVPRPPSTPSAPEPVVSEAPTGHWNTASVESCVRAALLTSFDAAGVDRERACRRFLESTRESAREGWPVRRFVEGLLESPDARVGLAAVRCLGALGDRSSATALERVLTRPELAGEALESLGALGEPAVAALERAMASPPLALRALLELCRISGPRVASVIERAARQARTDSVPSREALLDALTTTGPAAVEGLLRLAEERRAARDESTTILARLPLVQDGGPALASALAGERFTGDLGYRALLFLPAPEALPWLEERCASHRERPLALETLASFGGSAPLASVLRLAQGGRVPRADVLQLLVGLFEREAERGRRFSEELATQDEAVPLREWLALLIESEHPGAARALVPLVFCRALAADDQQWAALAIGEFGAAADGEQLRGELVARLSEDRRRSAACLVSIHALLGASGVERLLGSCSPGSVRRVLEAFAGAGRAGEAVRVHRVARALDGALAELAGLAGDKKELL